jgi:hypothetical protein
LDEDKDSPDILHINAASEVDSFHMKICKSITYYLSHTSLQRKKGLQYRTKQFILGNSKCGTIEVPQRKICFFIQSQLTELEK